MAQIHLLNTCAVEGVGLPRSLYCYIQAKEQPK
nr:MAG TPA_asm: hypothetical protein [Caudoviricetes sp.]DAN06376.1 MAG TPA: hypothetical protein [Caudoviricetes sp.]